MDKLFKLGVFLLPFDNLFFAPSAGWAAISPIIFFIYTILNLNNLLRVIKIESKKLFYIYFCIVYSFFLYLFYGINVSNVSDSILTLVLGVSFYFALIIRYYILKNNISKDLNILLIAYTISFFYGLLKYLALRLHISSILTFFDLIEKRYYDRVSFSFTEPSFVSVHVFGILLIIFLFLNKNRLKQKVLVLISLFSVLTIFSFASSRFLVDFSAVLILSLVYFILKSKTKLFYKASILVSFILVGISFVSVIDSNERIQAIVEDGIYGDSSLASRFFRVNASIEGYKEEPLNALFGAGIGNTDYFLKKGYDEAFVDYKNSYTYEILYLRDHSVNQLFSLPIRLVSELGILNFLIITLYFFSLTKWNLKKILSVLVVFWIYIQFDSYAFYSLWLLIFILTYLEKIKINEENLNRGEIE